MRIVKRNLFVDTNILIYTLDPLAPEKRLVVGELMTEAMQSGTLVVSPQSINEFYRAVTDKRRWLSRDQAREFISSLWPYCVAPLDETTIRFAWDLQDDHGFGWWDCLLLSAAIRARCETFLSEDMQDGRAIGGMTIVNPFAKGKPNQL